MSRIKLYFSDFPTPELYRIVFESSQSGTHTSVRGKTVGASTAEGTFQWTSAVKALSVLLLRNVVSGRFGSESISGGKGSIAASLDYALSKEPQWVFDVFGLDSSSKAFSRRLFRRSNPDGQRGGPRQVSLSLHQWKSIDVFISNEQERVFSPTTLKQLIVSIVGDELSDESSWESRFREVFFKEVRTRLANGYIFSPLRYRAIIESVLKNPSFQKLGGEPSMLVSELDNSLGAASRLGLDTALGDLNRIISKDEPIKALVPHTCAAALSLFWYLRMKGINVEIDFFQPHTVEVSKNLIDRNYSELPDLCVLAAPPAVALGTSSLDSGYSPLMLLPALSQRVIAPKGADKSLDSSREFLFVGDIPSMSTFLYDDLLRSKKISESKSKVLHMESDEVISSLRESNPFRRAILFFPHYHFNSWHNDSAALEIDGRIDDEHLSLLYGHESFMSDSKRAKALNIALRNAWLTMLEQSEICEQVLDDLLFNSDYLRAAKRFGGLHKLSTRN